MFLVSVVYGPAVTMTAPTRALAAVRPAASPGLLLTSGAIAATFMATPFVIAEAIDIYEISTGWAALLSTAQVGGFTAGNLYAGRRLRASTSLARKALLFFVICNLASALDLSFAGLVGLRTLAGVAMGLLTWIAWADSAVDAKKRGDIAAIGPVSSAIGAPLIALLASRGQLTGTYLALAAVAALGLLLPMSIATSAQPDRRPIETPGVRVVLVAMGLFGAGGSSIFVFSRVIASMQVGMGALVFSLALSFNALASIPTARYRGRRRLPGLWMAGIAVCAVLMATTESEIVFIAVVVVWGMLFWAVVPELFSMLSDRSAHPADRVGDAQAVMSIGRVVGPSLGGALVGTGSFVLLGWTAAGFILVAGIAIEATTTAHRWR